MKRHGHRSQNVRILDPFHRIHVSITKLEYHILKTAALMKEMKAAILEHKVFQVIIQIQIMITRIT